MKKKFFAIFLVFVLSFATLSVTIIAENKHVLSNGTANYPLGASTQQKIMEEYYKKILLTEEDTFEVSIISAGDILFHMPQVNSAAENGSYNFKPMFSEVKDIIASKDIAVANFETTINPKRKPSGYPSFNTPVQSLEAVKDAGFDILLNAHNHTLDTGLEGLRSTNSLMKKYGFKVVGSGEPSDDKSLIIEKNSIKIGMLSYTYGTNYGTQYTDMINYIDEKKIKKEVQKIDSACDFTIVYLHLGTEYVRTVERFQKDLIGKVASYGADAILCSHPHVARKTEMLKVNGKEVLVNYSMGNFISNQNDKYTDMGTMQSMVIEKSGNVTRIKETETIPVYRLRYSSKGKTIYRTVPASKISDYRNIIGANSVAYVNSIAKDLSFQYDALPLPADNNRFYVKENH